MSEQTYSVKCNEIDNELATEETLYSGLTKAVAVATARSCVELGEPDKYNYYVTKDKA